MSLAWRTRIWHLVEVVHDPSSHRRTFDWYDWSLSVLVLANVAAVMLETVPEFRASHGQALALFEWISVGIFTVEYGLRLWACPTDPRYARGSLAGRVRYALSFMAVVDLLAIAPFYLGHWFSGDLRFLWALRLFRLLRVLKLGRYSSSLAMMGKVLRLKSSDLLATIFALTILMILSASIMYHAEFEAQPDKFSSIPASLWWAVATLTTVGYGDIYPITVLGKFAASVIAVLGIGLFALPAGILADGFSELRRKESAPPACCPHCHREIG